MAGLNVSLPLIATIAQEIISLYTLWNRYKDDKASGDSARGASGSSSLTGVGVKRKAEDEDADIDVVTSISLTKMFLRMREARLADPASHPSSGGPALAVNKMLERTQAIV
jgi:cyclin C